MSRHFLEMHGVDISGKWLPRRARETLRDLPACPHASGSKAGVWPHFEDDSLDFIYSLRVLPAYFGPRATVVDFLLDAHRVRRDPGAWRGWNSRASRARRSPLARAFLNSPDDASVYALALEGVSTSSVWTTWRKRAKGWSHKQGRPVKRLRRVPIIRRITNASIFRAGRAFAPTVRARSLCAWRRIFRRMPGIGSFAR